jgi:serine phosphatase RsbU (regulator of sigma subunit)
LMSMLGVTLLNEQFRTFGIRKPGEILGHLRTKVKEILAQEGSVNDQKDGMDMAIAIIDLGKNELQFAGANIPLLLIRMKERIGEIESALKLSMENENFGLFRLKADKQPIGVYWEERDFSDHVIKLQELDSLYIFSDGYTDQYGGKNRKKLKSRRLKKLLLSVQEAPMETQKRLIVDAFEKWQGGNEQIDDVCAIGVRITI